MAVKSPIGGYVKSCLVKEGDYVTVGQPLLTVTHLASLAVAQSRHTVMARVERQIFELVALIYEDVVDAHLLEIHHVVRA